MSHHLITRLLFYPLAAALVLLLTLPTLGVMVLVAYNVLPFLAGWFFELATVAAGGLLLQPSIHVLRQQCLRAALGVTTRRYPAPAIRAGGPGAAAGRGRGAEPQPGARPDAPG